ncbi:hypothetical protein B9Z55_024771 [Caenorhabditis nigoni]|nr:hypothetical protein B9Z55_024771 [Caenorhabditis nigoni]
MPVFFIVNSLDFFDKAKLATDYQELKEKQGDEKDVEDAQDLQNFRNEAADNEQGQGEADEMEYDEQNRALPVWDHLNAHFSRNDPNDLELEAQDVSEFVAEETITASRLVRDPRRITGG